MDKNNENLISKTENMKRNPLKILELKTTVFELKNSLDGLNSRMEMVKEE